MSRKPKIVSPEQDRMSALARVATRFKSRPASEVLKKVRAVPTIFPQFDHATRVGGLPIERYTLVHGASAHGKTSFALGLMKSFLERQHYVLFLDAERSTPRDWVEQLFGAELYNSPLFLAELPVTYEEAIERVKHFLATITEAKQKGDLEPETSALVVVDSLRKLVPGKMFESIMKEGSVESEHSADGMGGRAGMIKAKWNGAWLDMVIPSIDEAGAAFVIVAREYEDPNAQLFSQKMGTNYKIAGGKNVVYDASMRMRVEHAGYVTEGDKTNIVGERHRVVIVKSKVAGKDNRDTVCYFHTSNGKANPSGFDRGRDVLELAKQLGIVQTAGAWLSYKEHRFNGESKAVHTLWETPELLLELEGDVRTRFHEALPVECEEA